MTESSRDDGHDADKNKNRMSHWKIFKAVASKYYTLYRNDDEDRRRWLLACLGCGWLYWRQQRQQSKAIEWAMEKNSSKKPRTSWMETPLLILDAVVLVYCARNLGPRKTKSEAKDDDNDESGDEMKEIQSRSPPAPRSVMPRESAQRSLPTYVPSSSKNERYLEILVHNVSHTDLMLSLDAPPSVDITDERIKDRNNDRYCLARARFSVFESLSRRLLTALGDPEDLVERLLWFPRYERSEEAPRFRVLPEPLDGERLAAGFRLGDGVTVEPHELRVRARDAARVRSNAASQLNAIFFPMLSTLLPRWNEQIRDKFGTNLPQHLKRVLVLVSGVGTPQNDSHSISGNSTELLAQILKMFVGTLYPSIHVVTIHSHTNIFRYDENIDFVQCELLPCLHSYRDAHAQGLPYPDETPTPRANRGWLLPSSTEPFETDWRNTCQVTLSFADGSPARNHAIQAALRASYRPAYCHFWQLKTFWHECKLVVSDIELHSFEEMETLPAMAAAGLQQQRDVEDDAEQENPNDDLLARVVDEMRAFRRDVTDILSNDSDLHSFWLRKTHKPVLAVLAVQQRGGIKLFRGTNMEVSMPTGSLCAERNVIGTALAADPALKRQDLKLIAVLAVPTPELAVTPLRSSQSGGSSAPAALLPPLLSPHSSEGDDDEWVLHDSSPVPTRRIKLYQGGSNAGSRASSTNSLADLHLEHARSTTKTVVVQSSNDMNPLRPCGACNEWLKKIAESNPYFQIVTFTDADCTGVYCSPCEG